MEHFKFRRPLLTNTNSASDKNRTRFHGSDPNPCSMRLLMAQTLEHQTIHSLDSDSSRCFVLGRTCQRSSMVTRLIGLFNPTRKLFICGTPLLLTVIIPIECFYFVFYGVFLFNLCDFSSRHKFLNFSLFHYRRGILCVMS